MKRYEFEVLCFFEEHGEKTCTLQELSDALKISKNAVEKAIEHLVFVGSMTRNGKALKISEAGRQSLEPYRAQRAIIVGAGMGTRMMPATADRPKPMVFVNGTRIIDSLIDALTAVGIRDIIVVGGYRFEVMERELREKYPFLRLLENKKYSTENNISSALLAKEYFCGGCYFCEADVLVRNPAIIRKYHYNSDILGSWSLETDDWCFKSDNGMLCDYKKGGTYCYNYYGISYWSEEDSAKLRKDWEELYEMPDGKNLFWEFPAFMIRKDHYKVEILPCEKRDVMEIDEYDELCIVDESYAFLGRERE